MAKQPEGISLLGKDLIRQAQTRSDTAARKAAKREEKGLILAKGFNFLTDIGNKALTKKNDQFLQQEGFYAKNAIFQANLKEDQKHMDLWSGRSAYEKGEGAYWRDMATAQIQTLPEHATFKAAKNASEYSSYMATETAKLADRMKKIAKENYTTASGRLSSYGENPEAFYKNQALKDRAENVWDALTLPVVNMFSGKDTRPVAKAIEDGISDEGGLASQGVVDKKVVKDIYLQTGNYKTALETAGELEDFRKSFKAGAMGLTKASPVFGEYKTVHITTEWGESKQESRRDVTVGGVYLRTEDGNGNNITAQVQKQKTNLQAATVPEDILIDQESITQSSLSSKDRDILNGYANAVLGDEPTEKQKNGFRQMEYGRMAVASKKLDLRFNSIDGWNPTFSKQLAAQMALEDIKLGFEDNKIFPDKYNPNKGLLVGTDMFHPYVALKALDSLAASGNAAGNLLDKNTGGIRPDLIRAVMAIGLPKSVQYTHAQTESVIRLAEELKLEFSKAPPTEEEKIQAQLILDKNKKSNTLLKLKTLFQVQTDPTVTSNANSKSYLAAREEIGSLEDNAALIQMEADARIKKLKEELTVPDIGMYAPRRKAVKKAEISRLQVNPNSILQD
tara:strand:- start:311 stop:2173 length:1863 start_codon:yes stop_codon:yes gene_type:complete